jgi:hypothetical protein
MESFSASVERAQRQGEEDTVTTVQTLDDLQRKQASIHRDLQCWITQLRVSQRESQERVVSETASHLQEVGIGKTLCHAVDKVANVKFLSSQVQGSIDHISETLDVLIEGAIEQTTHESDSAKALQKVAQDMHTQEVRSTRYWHNGLRLTDVLLHRSLDYDLKTSV